ncbi:vanadium-dependent haloperoxidase [Hymenobacter sp. 5317J-9]|uniref:vanadium-dependent haloperoxidase n=1 Tax=Hymenobacter sp. 5317J-9 TaxID=2932250 RepID=UPI001FD6CD73|nr:vanadium-dependent haloperoxidase [Hymenobacter sp. 5317J-9]UOQ99773.1 vanadium-dependent haloperoxidase [Hymenobacter sp. 5317J-9]
MLVADACSHSKSEEPATVSAPASSYRADVVVLWLNLQLKLVRTTAAGPVNTFGRPFGYSGIAGYEAVVPGIAGATSLGSQLNGLSGLPVADKTQAYNWALSANAALAAVNRGLFANTSAANKITIDSLEAANAAALQAGVGAEAQARSIDFGKQVAAAVLTWARTDGYDNAAPYTPPTGPGMWVPTAPAFAPAGFAYWGTNRPLVAGSGAGADPGPPLAYSAAPGSPFYAMAQEVYDLSQNLTADQRAIALFWNDAPNGRNFTPPGHWMSILTQVLVREQPALDKALKAYAKVGISMNDAAISCFKTKYTYTLLRPISYVRGELGHPGWLSLIKAPNFPDYSATHATLSAAAAAALTSLFGTNYAFTDQNYVQFGLGARSYTSFEQAGAEAGISRLYGGIHYRTSCEKGGGTRQKSGAEHRRQPDAALKYRPLG